jgi:DNA primase
MSVTDEVKERLDVVEVISAYVPLKKSGRSYKGLCPFHSEKTPSLHAFPDTQTWRCFGCNTGGDVFTFVMKRENLDFGEALQQLAAKAGVEVRPREPAAAEAETHLDRLRTMLSDAASYFSWLLRNSSEAAQARDYIAGRGLSDETCEKWQLGYSLDSWDALFNRLRGKGYTPGEIEEAGLAIARDDGIGHYDRFRGRLMIPIRDLQGRTIGFGARILREDPERPGPKYMNSPQSPLFDKSHILYGLDAAKKPIRDANLAVLVEGYMDVLMSHQVGVANVVAGMGTALTEAQMRQIKRFSANITLALDPDAAGDHAVLRGLESARQALDREWQPVIGPGGLLRQESRVRGQLRIAALPDGLDPDELALRDVQQWRQVIADARPLVDYYLAIVAREEDLTSARGKANAVARMAPLIGELANPVERHHYVQRLARLAQTSERLVEEQVSAAGKQGSRMPPVTPARREAQEPDQPKPAASPPSLRVRRDRADEAIEEHVLGWFLTRIDLMQKVDEDLIAAQATPLGPEDFARADHQAIIVALQSMPAPQTWEERGAWLGLPSPLQERAAIMVEGASRQPPLVDEKLIKDLGDCMLRLRERHLRLQLRQIQALLLDDPDGDGGPGARALQQQAALASMLAKHLHKLLTDRSMAGALARERAARQAPWTAKRPPEGQPEGKGK